MIQGKDLLQMKICKQMQMFDIHKMSPLLPRINLPQIFTFYDV